MGYCVGFRGEFGDSAACSRSIGSYYTIWTYMQYTLTQEYFDASKTRLVKKTFGNGFGGVSPLYFSGNVLLSQIHPLPATDADSAMFN